jgi:hypothetical protein
MTAIATEALAHASACKSGIDPELPNQLALQRKVTVLLPFEFATMVESISGEP